MTLGTAAQLCCIAEGFAAGHFESRPYFGGNTLCTVTGLPGGEYISRTIEATSAKVLRETLAEAYASALKKLPPRKKIIVTCGVVHYHRILMEKTLEDLGKEYVLNEGADALLGLKILAEEIK